MSILIKGMAIPKNCGECPCYYDGYCHGVQYREEDEDYRAVSYSEYDKKRRDNCPLVELPPHGRLIDADALPRFGGRKGLIHSADVDNAPTIIESEGEDGLL